MRATDHRLPEGPVRMGMRVAWVVRVGCYSLLDVLEWEPMSLNNMGNIDCDLNEVLFGIYVQLQASLAIGS